MKSLNLLLTVLAIGVVSVFVFILSDAESNPLPANVSIGTAAVTDGLVTAQPTAQPEPPTLSAEELLAWNQAQNAIEATRALTPLPSGTPWAAGIYGTEGDPLAASWLKQGVDVTNIVVGYLATGDQYVANVFVNVRGTGSGVILQRSYRGGGTGGLVSTSEFYPGLKAAVDHSGRIELVSDDGRTLYFDVLGMAFVGSLESPVPVWTPGSPIPGSSLSGYPAPPAEVTAAIPVP